jgi:hypothetical protein
VDAGAERGIVVGPMSIGEVVDSGFNLARRNFRHLAGIGAWGLVVGYFLQGALSIPSTALFGSAIEARPEQAIGAFALMFGGAVVGGIAMAFASMALVVACGHLVDPASGERLVKPGYAYRTVLSRVPALIGLGIILVLAAIPLAFIFPLFIYVFVRWANATNLVVLDSRKPVEALQRSWALTRGVWWHTAVVLFLAWLAVAVVQIVLGMVVGVTVAALQFALEAPVVAQLLNTVLGAALAIVISPFSVAVSVVLYYELRARTEGFDLERRILEVAPAE